MADTQLSTKQRVGFAAAPLALIAALVAALGTNDSAHEGRRYTPYYDSAGILGLPMMGIIMGALNGIQATFGDDDEP